MTMSTNVDVDIVLFIRNAFKEEGRVIIQDVKKTQAVNVLLN